VSPGTPLTVYREDVILSSSCISEETYKDTVGEISKDCKWKLKLPPNMALSDYMKIRCTDKGDAALKRIIPIIYGLPSVCYYHPCVGNIYNAIKRQSIEVTDPDPKVMEGFFSWYEYIFATEIEPILRDFKYSYNVWYNHLTAGQQSEIDGVRNKDDEKLKVKHYKMFCKCEKQIVDGAAPKNRCICAPCAEYKLVMGPIVYRLETMFKTFKGYGVGKNWTEKEELYNTWTAKGFTKIVQGDGSGFDRTQKLIHKRIEGDIYRFIAPFVTHVPEDVFLYQALTYKVKIFATHIVKDGKIRNMEDLGYIEMADAVQSGNMDTTFANTLRMALYNRYTIEVVMKVPRDAYDLTCAGDDFIIALQTLYSDEDIIKTYDVTFSRAKTGKHGLGQILKYLKIGEIDSIDFCSTETFWSETLKSWKIIRQLPRFLTLTPYSNSCLALSEKEQDNYMNDQYISNLKWMDGLPIFTEYNNLLRRPTHSIPPKKGAVKKILPTTEFDAQFLDKVDDYQTWLQKTFSKDDFYAKKDRISSKKGCEADFLKHLERQYGMTPNTVSVIQEELRANATNGVLYSFSLVEACDFKKTDVRHYSAL